MLNYELKKFDNGLRLITCPIEGTKAVTVLFLFGVGSRFETEKLSGLSHFLEHMYFKGTNKRPTTLDISKELDGVGAGFNAYTGEELTGFFVRVSTEHFNLGLDILDDMLFNSKFDAQEIEKEKGVIIEEINMYNDDPRSKVEDVAKDLVYPGHPLGRSIAGVKETVSAFSREDFVSYREKFYNPSNMVIAVAGGGMREEWLQKIEEKFNQLGDKEIPSFEPVKVEQTEPAVALFKKETDQAHFILAFRGLKRSDKRRPIYNILTNLMGQMMSSRLFIEVREKRGLCYYVGADKAEYHDTGAWFVSAGVDIKRTEEAVKVILDEIEKLKNEPVTDEELNRAKENFKGHMFLSLEESMSVASMLAEQELLLQEMKDPDQIAKEIDAVTKEDIQNLAQELFILKNLNLAMVSPEEDKEKYLKILKEFK